MNCTPAPDCHGNPNQALHFNGSNSWVQVPASQDFCVNEWTINIVFKPTAFNSSGANCQYMELLMHQIPGTNGHFSVDISDHQADGFNCAAYSPGLQQVFASAGSTPPAVPYPGPPVALGQWHCFTACYRDTAAAGTNVEYYIDGAPFAIHAWPATYAPPCSPLDVLIGRGQMAGLDTWFNGDIDDIQIFQNAMSPADIPLYLPCPCGTTSCCAGDTCSITDVRIASSTNSPFVRNFQAVVNPTTRWVHWYVNGSLVGTNGSTVPYTHTFPGAGTYGICAVAYNPVTNRPCDTSCFEICICQNGLRPAGRGALKIKSETHPIGDAYPNPANTDLFLPTTGYSGEVGISVQSLDGKVISRMKRTNIENDELLQVDISKLAPGTYYIEVEMGLERHVKKFVRL